MRYGVTGPAYVAPDSLRAQLVERTVAAILRPGAELTTGVADGVDSVAGIAALLVDGVIVRAVVPSAPHNAVALSAIRYASDTEVVYARPGRTTSES